MSVCDWSKIIEDNKKNRTDKYREDAIKSVMAAEVKSPIEEAESEMEN